MSGTLRLPSNRAFGRDAMKRRFEPRSPSYWVKRDPPGPPDDSFRDMF